MSELRAIKPPTKNPPSRLGLAGSYGESGGRGIGGAIGERVRFVSLLILRIRAGAVDRKEALLFSVLLQLLILLALLNRFLLLFYLLL